MSAEVLHHASGPGFDDLIKLVNLAVVGAIIYFGAGKGIVAGIKARAELISKKIVDAKIELERITHETDRARREIAEISKTKEKFVAEIRDEGLKVYAAIVQDAKTTAARILADAKLAADNEVTSAVAKVRAELVSKSLQKALLLSSDPSALDLRHKLHERLLDRFVTQLQSKEGV